LSFSSFQSTEISHSRFFPQPGQPDYHPFILHPVKPQERTA